MFQRLAKFLEVREATDDEVSEAFEREDYTAERDAIKVDSNGYRAKSLDSTNAAEDLIDAEIDLATEIIAHETQSEVQPSREKESLVAKSRGVSAEEDDFLQGSALRPTMYETNHVKVTTPTPHIIPVRNMVDHFSDVLTNGAVHQDDDQLSEVSLGSPKAYQTVKVSSFTDENFSEPSEAKLDVAVPLIPTVKLKKKHQNAIEPTSEVPTGRYRVLDDKLLALFSQPDSHLSDTFDEDLVVWAQSGTPSNGLPSADIEQNRSRVPPHASLESSSKDHVEHGMCERIQLLESQLHDFPRMQVELQQKTDRLFFLETELVASERSRLELEDRMASERLANLARIRDLEQDVKLLSDELLLIHSKSLGCTILESRKETNLLASQAATSDLMKHCIKLTRRLEANNETKAASDAAAAKIAGQQLAALSAKTLMAEQQIKDEKLVLKNLFLSWLERGERKDAFEILARAFEFTPEDRKRMEAKNVLARGASLGVKWSLSEGIADFIRDETS